MVDKIQNLMLIDDDEDDREIFLSIVKEACPEISLSIAANGWEALQALQNSLTPPDLILDDNLFRRLRQMAGCNKFRSWC